MTFVFCARIASVSHRRRDKDNGNERLNEFPELIRRPVDAYGEVPALPVQGWTCTSTIRGSPARAAGRVRCYEGEIR